MAFSHSRYTDARRSNFQDIGRDYTSNNVHFDNRTININLSVSGITVEAITNVLRDFNVGDKLPPPTSSSQKNLVPLYRTSTTASGIDVATRLIVRIMQLLIDPGAWQENYRDLKRELESLHQILVLTGLAFQVYQFTPLGHNLGRVVDSEVQRCGVLLQDLLAKTQSFQLGLNPTSIGCLWRQILWRGWDEAELTSLRMKMLTCKQSLGRCLIAVNSYVPLSY